MPWNRHSGPRRREGKEVGLPTAATAQKVASGADSGRVSCTKAPRTEEIKKIKERGFLDDGNLVAVVRRLPEVRQKEKGGGGGSDGGSTEREVWFK